MQQKTIATDYLSTLVWVGNSLVDWVNSGRTYYPNEEMSKIGKYHFAYSFDSAIASTDGIYAVLYKKLGTKGLLLKNGEIIREINRSYYQAEVYEYPVAFAKLKDGTDILIHCPDDYCKLDFEEVETGIRLTSHINRNPSDFFHSRLEVSPDNKTLLSKGWAWHPFDFVYAFDIEECIKNPQALDTSQYMPEVDAEICTASFIDNELVLIGSPNDSEPFDDEPSDKLKSGEIGIWNIKNNTITGIIKPHFTVGGCLIAINEALAWDLYENPKIINFRTGQVIEELKDVASGKQTSSIIHHLKDDLPLVAYNPKTKQIAIGAGKTIELLSPAES